MPASLQAFPQSELFLTLSIVTNDADFRFLDGNGSSKLYRAPPGHSVYLVAVVTNAVVEDAAVVCDIVVVVVIVLLGAASLSPQHITRAFLTSALQVLLIPFEVFAMMWPGSPVTSSMHVSIVHENFALMPHSSGVWLPALFSSSCKVHILPPFCAHLLLAVLNGCTASHSVKSAPLV